MCDEQPVPFVRRDWSRLRSQKSAAWLSHKTQGVAASVRLAEALRQQVLRARPLWPGAELRREDLEAHRQLSEQMRRAGPSLSR